MKADVWDYQTNMVYLAVKLTKGHFLIGCSCGRHHDVVVNYIYVIHTAGFSCPKVRDKLSFPIATLNLFF